MLAPAVFQEIEYGALVSAAPRLAPSSLNWTLPTVRAPTMLTLALTGTVPATVDPEAGEVIVTTRLPVGRGGSSCARARGGIQLALKKVSNTANQTRLIVFVMENASQLLGFRGFGSS